MPQGIIYLIFIVLAIITSAK